MNCTVWSKYHTKQWRCIFAFKSKDQIPPWKTLMSRVTKECRNFKRTAVWSCTWLPLKLHAFKGCGNFSTFACQQFWHCHRELHIKNVPETAYMVSCSQHSSQVATSAQHDKIFSTAGSCSIQLAKSEERGKSLEWQTDLQEYMLRFKKSQKCRKLHEASSL